MQAQNKVVPLFNPETSIRIGDTVIHMDENNRYCLNDLHKASGGEEGYKPKYWLRTPQTKNLIKSFLKFKGYESSPLKIEKGKYGGTYAHKFLVYSYAEWISSDFHLHVLDIYDRVVMAEHIKLEAATEKLKHTIPLNQNCLKSITGSRNNNDINLLYQAMEQDGLVVNQDIIKVLHRWVVTTKGAELFGAYNSQSGIRISKEYHDALRDLMQKILHEDQEDWTMDS